MLTRMKLTNFKSWRELDIELAPLTLLFGTNSSGKTSILQALLLLKHGVTYQDFTSFGGEENSVIDLGSYQDVIYKHQNNLGLDIYLDFVPPDEKEIEGLGAKIINTSFVSRWVFNDTVVLSQMGFQAFREDKTEERRFINRETDGSYSLDQVTNLLNLNESSPIDNILHQVAESMIENILSSKLNFHIYIMIILFSQLVTKIKYLGPLRNFPKRTYLWTGSTPGEIGWRGENTIEMLLSSERGNQNGKPSLLQQVSEWLAKMGLVDKLKVDAIDTNRRFYEPKANIAGTDSALIDTGFGVSQVLPVLTMLFSVPENSIVLLEQPELHLHPGAQAHLADLLLHVAETRNLQLIVETHSEHLLTRLQRRVAEENPSFAKPDNIRMYFCQPGENGSIIQPIDLDQYGQLRNEPSEFFGDISGDLDALTRAALAKRRKELAGG